MATEKHSPLSRGFDSWLGYWHHSNDYYTQNEQNCHDNITIKIYGVLIQHLMDQKYHIKMDHHVQMKISFQIMNDVNMRKIFF